MRLFGTLILGLFLLIGSPAKAQVCSIPASVSNEAQEALIAGQKARVEEGAKLSIELDELLYELYNVTTVKIPDAMQLALYNSQIETMKADILEKLNTQPLPILRIQILNYFTSAALLKRIELYLSGQNELRKLELVIPTDIVGLLYSSTTFMPYGVTLNIGDKFSRLQLSGQSLYEASFQYLSKSTKSILSGEAYFKSTRCMLSYFYMGKAQGLSLLLGEMYRTPQLAENQKICVDLKPQDLVSQNAYLTSALRKEHIAGFISNPREAQYMSGEDDFYIENKVKEMGINFKSFLLNHRENEELSETNNALRVAENKFYQDRKFTGLKASLDYLTVVIQNNLKNCNTDSAFLESVLHKFSKTNQQLVSHLLSLYVSNSALNIFSEQHLQSAVVQALGSITEDSLVFTLLNSGFIEPSQVDEMLQNLRPAIQNYLEKEKSVQLLAGQIQKHLDEKKKEKPSLIPELLANEKFQEARQSMADIMDPKTALSQLEFREKSMNKLFEGRIAQLGAPYAEFVDRIVGRETWQSKAELFKTFQDEIRLDQEEHGYECVPVDGLEWAWDLGRTLVGAGPVKNKARREDCDFFIRWANHMGLTLSQEPKTFADIFQSFKVEEDTNGKLVETYDEKTRNDYAKTYREILKGRYANVFRVLDVPMSSLGEEFEDSKKRVFDFITDDYKSSENLGLMEKAFRYTQANLETNLLVALHSEDIEDLHPFIRNTFLLNHLYGAKEFQEREIPSVFYSSEATEHALVHHIYQKHVDYQNELFRTEGFNQRMNRHFIDVMDGPLILLGLTGVARFALLRTPYMKTLGAGLFSLANSTRVITSSYFQLVNVLFAAAALDAAYWNYDITKNMEKLETLKFSDFYLSGEGDLPLINYDDYLTQKISQEANRSSVRKDLVIYGAFTAFAGIMRVWSPYAATRAIKKDKLKAGTQNHALENLKKTNILARGWLRSSLKADVARLKITARNLNLTSYELSAIQAARNASKSKMASEQYRRVIYTLGQRISPNLGRADREKLMSKILYGTEHRVSELRKISDEYQRLFPDITGSIR